MKDLINSAKNLELNYVFIDKNTLIPKELDKLKEVGYNVLVGQGDQARIKISW